MNRTLINVQTMINAVGDQEQMWHGLRDLADELNSELPEYEVELTHHDTGDYLAFARRDQEDRKYFESFTAASDEEIARHLLALAQKQESPNAKD